MDEALTWRQRVIWLCPLWWIYHWWIGRWIRHDCDRQPITCRLPWDLWLGWLDTWQSK